MRKLKYSIVALVATIFIGCEDHSSFQINNNGIQDVPKCTETLKLNSNDIVKATEDNTQFVFDHDENNHKTVCVKSGAATVTKGK